MRRTTARKLPARQFAAIYRRVPRLCVDAVIRGPRGVVFAKRDIEPWRGQWHIPGGTVRLNERLTDAVARIVREETGLTVRVGEPLGSIEYLYARSRIHNHSVSVVLLVSPVSGKLRGSPQGREVRYFSRMPHSIIPAQKKFLKQQKLV